MTQKLPRVFNIEPGGNFLDVLAASVLDGFPIDDASRPLSDWTILLPTRRAARELGEILRRKKNAKALILPRIRPIGDLDEDRLASEMDGPTLPKAMPPVAQLFVLLDLLGEWLAQNPALPFAVEIAASPLQRIALAESLNELLQRVEVQECGFEGLTAAYDAAEFSQHREAILGLFALLSRRLPEVHQQRGTMGAAARRSAVIRAEAKRIAEGKHAGPIIAAGSTGTIPATRVLLEAIARHNQGAVVLPGLDAHAEEKSWKELPPEHPQFALRELLDSMGLKRIDIHRLGPPGRRSLLSSELMRPSVTAAEWHEKLPAAADALSQELQGLVEVAAPDRHIEARSIALLMREALTIEDQTAALVTPDRDLANRVVSELKRYDITIEDSAGTSLAKLGSGSLLDLLCAACMEGFSAESLMAALRHPDVTLGLEKHILEQGLQKLEVACLRGLPLDMAELDFAGVVTAAQAAQQAQFYAHPLVAALDDAAWQDMATLAQGLDAVFNPLRLAGMRAFADHLETMRHALAQLAPGRDATSQVNAAVEDLLDDLADQAALAPQGKVSDAALLVQHFLRATSGPPPAASHRRLAILGALEARLMPADVMILGGLNETIWPQQADSGPWLNRTMRGKAGLPQPEREIGLAAHDFVQGLGHRRCVITWSRRLGNAPAGASRWLLRLQTVLKTAKLPMPEEQGAAYVHWARALHHAEKPKPLPKPRPCPPLALRPTVFPVTKVERLVRNPYAIFARDILKLEPLPDFGFTPENRLRGSLFHDAIALWNKAGANGLESLLEAGRAVFAPFQNQHEIMDFWWPQFQRIANWLADEEQGFKHGLLKIHAEVSGSLEFEIAGTPHKLTARADRIDALENEARIIDYKTGEIPSPKKIAAGFSPQMPLEAAILLNGGFKNIRPGAAIEARYLHIAASMDGLENRLVKHPSGKTIAEMAADSLAGFKQLAEIYRSPTQTYLPRLNEFKEQDEADYDHLSRYLEWQLAGES